MFDPKDDTPQPKQTTVITQRAAPSTIHEGDTYDGGRDTD